MTPQHIHHMDERLWNWLDGQASPAEAAELQQLTTGHAQWQARYAELQQLHQSLQADMELMQPSMRFTKNVMEQIAALSIQTTTRQYLNNRVLLGIGSVFVAIIALLVVYTLSAVEWSSAGSSPLQVPGQSLLQWNWGALASSKWASAAAMMVVLLAMLALDQYLRPRLLKKGKAAY